MVTFLYTYCIEVLYIAWNMLYVKTRNLDSTDFEAL